MHIIKIVRKTLIDTKNKLVASIYTFNLENKMFVQIFCTIIFFYRSTR